MIPSLQEALAVGRPAPLLTLAVAGWFRYLRGEDEQGRSYPIDDPRAAELQVLARQGGADPRPLLDLTDLFGGLGHSEAFVLHVTRLLEQLDADGARATLARALEQEGKPACHGE